MLLLCLIFHGRLSSSAPVNKEITREIDASNAIVRMRMEIKTGNLEQGEEYRLLFASNVSEHIAYLSVKAKGGKDLELVPPTNTIYENLTYTEYVVYAPFTNPVFSVSTVLTSLLVPLPKEIMQLENQLMQLFDSHYVLSPYHTTTQKYTIKLPSRSIESFSKLEPYSLKGTTLNFGPYKEVPALSISPLQVHFVANKPFAKFSSMEREVEVSHWGKIAIEEIYELKHAGAKLKGGFSRYDHSVASRNSENGADFNTLSGKLPRRAKNIYYRDQIGNISSSAMVFKKDHIAFDVSTRFPMFGGWQTQFYIGYSLPAEVALSINEESGRYSLVVDFFTIFKNVWVENLKLKVILPEGCNDIRVDVPYPHKRSDGVRYTYLDSSFNGGRKVIVIEANNLVEEHDKKITISYSFSKYRMFAEPLMLIFSFFAFFVICMIFSRLESKIDGFGAMSVEGKKEKTE